MARRAFLAELGLLAAQEERQGLRQVREIEEARAAATEAEYAKRNAAHAKARFERASAAEQACLTKEVVTAYLQARQLEVEALNAQLLKTYAEIDFMLHATLEVDDYFDLNAFKKRVVHPPFPHDDLRQPTPLPDPGVEQPKPGLQLPPEPSGLFAIFGKRKRQRAMELAKLRHEQSVSEWTAHCNQLHAYRQNAAEAHRQAELQRMARLKSAEEGYEAECAAREREIAEYNREVDNFVSDLSYGSVEAIENYIALVLGKSCYPESFPVEHEASFSAAAAELQLRIKVPAPSSVPTIKAYRYIKASDKITESTQSQKASKHRYANAVHQVALRSLHEVFEADRRGLIKTISVEVGTDTLDPATGNPAYVPFLATGVSRGAFLAFDLANVTPLATLELLGAALSKNPFGLVPARLNGVRRA